MSFGEQLRRRREELGISRAELAEKLGVSRSAIGNYETGVSAPKEDVLLRLFDALQVDPNYLYRDSFRAQEPGVSEEELRLVKKYRRLNLTGRRTVYALVDSLGQWQEELEAEMISLYRLDQIQTDSSGKQNLGPLPQESVILLISLAVIRPFSMLSCAMRA